MATVLMASCSIQEEDFQTPQQEDVIYHASFEQPIEDGTRVYVNEDIRLRWTVDDRVSIFNKNTYNQEYRFIGETGDHEGGFNKVGDPEFITGDAIHHIVSVYPFRRLTRITEDETIHVTLPSELPYAENSFGLGANTMVSVSTGNLLYYKNVGGYLMLKLYGEGVSVSSITLKGNNGEKLAGDATVTMPLNGVPTVVMASDATEEITIFCDTPVALGETPEESTQFWFVVPPVTFSKGITITVNDLSGGTFEKSTDKTIAIERNNLSKMSPIEVVHVLEAVDLGLPSGLKWASWNLGASTPEEYGDYYAWGETEPYYNSQDLLTWKTGKENGYSWASYKWCMGSYDTLTKYCNRSVLAYNGFTDDKTVLDPEDDAAYVNLGGFWRTPTDAEWEELIDNCTCEWTSMNGVNGMKVTSNKPGYTDKYIFLPAAGHRNHGYLNAAGRNGYYWSSALNNAANPHRAGCLFFNLTDVGGDSSERYFGFSVRPVYGDPTVSVESVSMNKTELELSVGKSSTLTATVLPDNATYKTVTWSSSNTSVVIVSSSGVVAGVSSGSAVITVTTIDGGKTATCNVTVSPYTVATPEAVDLGLPSGLKWASFNLGASVPEEYGDHFAWGETEPYYRSQNPLIWKEGKEEGYSWASYKWCKGSSRTMTKYCFISSYGYNGFTDDKTVLDPEDDAAHVNLGGKWRMPTEVEWKELMNNCTKKWTTLNGVNGRLVTGSNGNSIFLPAAGDWSGTNRDNVGSYGHYWSSSLNTDYYPYLALRFYIFSGGDHKNTGFRYYGFSVRPVTE